MQSQLCDHVNGTLYSMISCAGKVSNSIGHIRTRRITQTSKNTLTPFYGVQIGNSTQVHNV